MKSMLPRVALFDSLDSSVGSKPYASRDLDMRDMDTIDESLDRNGSNAAFYPQFCARQNLLKFKFVDVAF